MDLWAKVYLGDRSVCGHGEVTEKVEVQQDVMLTTLNRDISQLKGEFLNVMGETFDRIMKVREMELRHGYRDPHS